MTEKGGSEVKAVRIHTDKKKGTTEFYDELSEYTDKWNIKGIWRLYEDEFNE